jgi:hypothetical protein
MSSKERRRHTMQKLETLGVKIMGKEDNGIFNTYILELSCR